MGGPANMSAILLRQHIGCRDNPDKDRKQFFRLNIQITKHMRKGVFKEGKSLQNFQNLIIIFFLRIITDR